MAKDDNICAAAAAKANAIIEARINNGLLDNKESYHGSK